MGGDLPPYTGQTEEYNGSSWSEQNDLATARGAAAGMGTQTAGLLAGGITTPGAASNATEEYDGANWTTGGNLNTARFLTRGAGTQTAGLVTGGTPPTTAAVESYGMELLGQKSQI
jgi:hypothetical protein